MTSRRDTEGSRRGAAKRTERGRFETRRARSPTLRRAIPPREIANETRAGAPTSAAPARRRN